MARRGALEENLNRGIARGREGKGASVRESIITLEGKWIGGSRGGAGGGIREPGRGKLEGGSWTSQERCVGRGRIGVESMTGRGGSQQRPLAFRSAPRPAPSPLILTVHRPGTPAGGHQSVHRRSSCTELRHVETHGEPPAGGGIRAGGGIPAGSARARILRARRPTPPGFEDLGRRRTGE